MNKKRIAIFTLIILGAFIAGEIVFAQGRPPGRGYPLPTSSSTPAPPAGGGAGYPQQRLVFGLPQIAGTLNTLVTALWGALTVAAVIMFLVGGFRYLTSQGDSEKVKAATKTLVYGLVALAVGLVARGLIYLVDQIIA